MQIADPDAAKTLDQMAVVSSRSGEHRLAKQCAWEALAVRKQIYPAAVFPQGHRDLALSMMRLASMEWTPGDDFSGDRAAAGRLYDDARKMFEASYSLSGQSAGGPDYAECL
jgi:hypothetical protein